MWMLSTVTTNKETLLYVKMAYRAWHQVCLPLELSITDSKSDAHVVEDLLLEFMLLYLCHDPLTRFTAENR